jgi:hypothetical protein
MAMLRLAGSRSLTTLVADQQVAAGDFFQAGDHAQQRGLAAARGADQHDEFAVLDLALMPWMTGTADLPLP